MAKTVFKLQIAEIAALSKQYLYWKVHWFGGLSLNLTTYEPQIDVYLAPLISPESATKKTGKLIFNGSYEFSEMRFVQIGIGHLPIFGLGTIFRDGRPFSRPKYVTKEFTVRITESKQEYIPVRASWGKHNGRPSYYVPHKQYHSFPSALSAHSLNESPNKTEQWQSSRETFHGKLLLINFDESERPLVSNKDNPLYSHYWQLERLGKKNDKEPETMFPVHGLIINPIEMVRFYYANSSQLYQEILTGGLSNDPNRIFNPAHTIQPNADGNGFLRLTKYVKDVDAPLIARLAFDRYARRQAAHIYASSLNSGAVSLSQKEGTAQSRFCEAFFPFENQETKLKVHGTYLQSRDRIYFLVLWIESCTAPFPYQKFDYWRDNPGNKTAEGSEISRDATLPPKLVPTEKPPPGPDDKFYDPDYTPFDVTEYIKTRHPKETTLQSEISPSVSRDELELISGARNKFPDLKKKKWEKKTDNASREIIQVEDPELDQVFIGISEDTETGATGPKSGTKPVTPVSFAEDFQDEANENTLADQPLFDIPQDEDLTYQPTERKKSEAEDSKTKSNAEEPDEAEQPSGEKTFETAEPTSGEKLPEDEQINENLAALERFPIVQGICRVMPEVEPSLTASIVEITRDGEKVYRETPSRFPTYWKHRANPVQDYEEKPIYEALAYIIEIKSTDDRFAYLFNIEPLVNAAGNTEREYRMFLCFDKELFKEFAKSALLRVLAIGEESDGNWLPKDNNNAKVGRHRFNHNADSDAQYAMRIAGVLKKAKMLIKPKSEAKPVTPEQSETMTQIDNVVIAQVDSHPPALV